VKLIVSFISESFAPTIPDFGLEFCDLLNARAEAFLELRCLSSLAGYRD
jgi:hypothetical protein